MDSGALRDLGEHVDWLRWYLELELGLGHSFPLRAIVSSSCCGTALIGSNSWLASVRTCGFSLNGPDFILPSEIFSRFGRLD